MELSACPSINPKTAFDAFRFTENLRAIQAGFRERIVVLDSDAHVKLGGTNALAVSNDADGCHISQADLYFVLNRQSEGY